MIFRCYSDFWRFFFWGGEVPVVASASWTLEDEHLRFIFLAGAPSFEKFGTIVSAFLSSSWHFFTHFLELSFLCSFFEFVWLHSFFFLFFFRRLRSSGLFVSDCCCGLVTFFLFYVCVFSPPQTHLSLCVFFLFLKAPGFPVGFLFLLSGCLTSVDISTSCSFGLWLLSCHSEEEEEFASANVVEVTYIWTFRSVQQFVHFHVVPSHLTSLLFAKFMNFPICLLCNVQQFSMWIMCVTCACFSI